MIHTVLIKSPVGECVLDLENDFTLCAFSSLMLEKDCVGPGALSVRTGGWSTGGGVAEEEESGAFPLSNTTSPAGGVARADEGIYRNILCKYCISFREDIFFTTHHLLKKQTGSHYQCLIKIKTLF